MIDTLGGQLARVMFRILGQPTTLRLYTLLDGQALELQGGGYQGISIPFAEWVINTTTPGLAIAEAPVVQFRFDGSRRFAVVGAYLTQDSDNGVLYLRSFPEALDVGRRGDVIPVRPQARIGPLA